MKAIIMAGGEGARLRPLTCDCPKPIVSMLNRPVMRYALDLIKRHGITEIGATLHYQPEKIVAEFGDELTYFIEEAPLGTAGSIKLAREFINDTFIVLSGDGLTNCDLTSAINFHKQRGALATLVLKRVDFPLDYGVIMLDANGLIRRFLEKPGWNELFSDTVNTGIYILEPEVLSLIPDGSVYDFGKQLFPAMVAKDLPVYGYVMDGYWCDIGDQRAYLRAHRDLLDGVDGLNNASDSINIARSAYVHPGATITPPCIINAYSRIDDGAQVGPYASIGQRCVVRSGARVERSVLWDGCVIGVNSGIMQAVVCKDAVVGEGSCLFPDSALGEGAVTGRCSEILPGARVWPHRHTPEGGTVSENWVWQDSFAPSSSDGWFALNSPQQAARFAQAYAIWSHGAETLVCAYPNDTAQVVAGALSCGLRAQGVNVINAGCAFTPQAREVLTLMGTSGALIAGDKRACALEKNGVPLNNDQLRALEGIYMRQDHIAAFTGDCGAETALASVWTLYTHRIVKRECDLAGMHVAIYAPHEIIARTLCGALTRMGCECRASWTTEPCEFADGEIGIFIDDACENLRICDNAGALNDANQTRLTVAAAISAGVCDCILTRSAAHVCADIIEKAQVNLHTISGGKRVWLKALADMLPTQPCDAQTQIDLFFDPIAATLRIIAFIKSVGNLRNAIGKSGIYRRSVIVPCSFRDKGRLLRTLLKESPKADATDGIIIAEDCNFTQILPSSVLAECRITAQARSMEAAQELCDVYINKVNAILGNQSMR